MNQKHIFTDLKYCMVLNTEFTMSVNHKSSVRDAEYLKILPAFLCYFILTLINYFLIRSIACVPFDLFNLMEILTDLNNHYPFEKLVPLIT